MASNNTQGSTTNGATSSSDLDRRDEYILALQQNKGLDRIHAALDLRLRESGWMQDLREYLVRLFRSGAITTYDDAMKVVSRLVNFESKQALDVSNQINDSSLTEYDLRELDKRFPPPDLTVSIDAERGGGEAVRKEFLRIMKPKKPASVDGEQTERTSHSDLEQNEVKGGAELVNRHTTYGAPAGHDARSSAGELNVAQSFQTGSLVGSDSEGGSSYNDSNLESSSTRTAATAISEEHSRRNASPPWTLHEEAEGDSDVIVGGKRRSKRSTN